MKDAIDHVLPWIGREIVGRELAEIVSREVRKPVSVVTFKLKKKGRYYGWNVFGANEIELVAPKNRRGGPPGGNVAGNIAAKRMGLA